MFSVWHNFEKSMTFHEKRNICWWNKINFSEHEMQNDFSDHLQFLLALNPPSRPADTSGSSSGMATAHVLLYIHGKDGELCHFLSALNPWNGEEIWRHLLEEEWSLQKVHKKSRTVYTGAAAAGMTEISTRQGMKITKKGKESRRKRRKNRRGKMRRNTTKKSTAITFAGFENMVMEGHRSSK